MSVSESDVLLLHADGTVLNLGEVCPDHNRDKYFSNYESRNHNFHHPYPVGYSAVGNAFSEPQLQITSTILAGDDGPRFQVRMRTRDADMQPVVDHLQLYVGHADKQNKVTHTTVASNHDGAYVQNSKLCDLLAMGMAG